MAVCDCLDFEVSWDFYRAHCIQFHNFDPGDNYPPEDEPIIKDEPEWTNQQWDVVNQLRAEVVGWRKKHAEVLLEIDRLKKGKPKKKDRI